MKTGSEAVLHVVEKRLVDIAGLPVSRLLPARKLRSVGPWVFLDHIGPYQFPPGKGIDVIPHPHINLATVTYLFAGEIIHRDTLGNVQAIRPGAINLMTAGKGIAHSERTALSARGAGPAIHGIQLWHALPETYEESPPGFEHPPAETIPSTVVEKTRLRVMMGSAFGVKSPVRTYSPTLYAEASIPGGEQLKLPDDVEELAIYPIDGDCCIQGDTENRNIGPGLLAVLKPGAVIESPEGTRLIIIGGNPLGKRYMWWNFISSRQERIAQASMDWQEGRFGPVIGDDGPTASLPNTDGFRIME